MTFKVGDVIRVAKRLYLNSSRPQDFPEIVSGAYHIVLKDMRGSYITNIPPHAWVASWFEQETFNSRLTELERIIWDLPLGD